MGVVFVEGSSNRRRLVQDVGKVLKMGDAFLREIPTPGRFPDTLDGFIKGTLFLQAN